MKLKSKAHDLLSLLFQQGQGAACNNMQQCQKLILGKFNRKCKETSCHLRQTDSFIPWCSLERDKELKKGSDGKLIKSGAPKRLWKDILELESYVRLNTA